MNVEVVVAQYVIGALPTEELPRVAMELLETGVDSEALAVLAGSTRDEHPAELRKLFEAGLHDLGCVVPGRLDAAHLVKNELVRRIAIGELAPRPGLQAIIDVYFTIDLELQAEGYVGQSFGIAQLYGKWDALSEPNADIERLEREIIDECRALAAPL